MGKKKKLNPFQYKELMQAEKIAAPMIVKAEAELRKKCLLDQLNLESLMVSQALSLYFWILHDKFEWGNKRLTSLLNECMDSLAELPQKISESGLDYVDYISKWFEDIRKNIKISVRAIKEDEDLGMIFGGGAKYASVIENIPWKKTDWSEENTLSDKDIEENSNNRQLNRARTILDQYMVDAKHRLLRVYAQDSSRDCRTIQNIVLAAISVKLHESFGFGYSRLVKIIGYMDDLAKCFSSRFDGGKGGYISIEDIMIQLKEETKIELPGIMEEAPFRIGQYIIDLSETGEVVWKKE